MKSMVVFYLICSYSFNSGTPQGVVNLIMMTLVTGLITLLSSSSIWPGSLFLIGIVGGLVVLMSFTFMMFPKESFKENKKLFQLKDSFLLPLFFSMLFYLLMKDSDMSLYSTLQNSCWSTCSISSFEEISEPFSSFSPLLLGFIFLFLFVILLSVESITKLIS